MCCMPLIRGIVNKFPDCAQRTKTTEHISLNCIFSERLTR